MKQPVVGCAVVAALAGFAGGLAAQPVTTLKPPTPAAKTEPGPNEGRPIREIILRRPAPRKTPAEEQKYEALDETLTQLVMNQLRTRVGAPYAEQLVSEDITRLNRLARFKQIDARTQALSDGSVTVTFTLLPQAIIADVAVAGNKKVSDQEVAAEVDVLVGTPIDEWEIDRSARRIEGLYRKKGYYLARVRVNREELEKASVVLFEVTEGERVKVMDIRFEGNRSFTRKELESSAGEQQRATERKGLKTSRTFFWESIPLDKDTLDSDVAGLVQFYHDRGYLNVRVDYVVQPSIDGKEAIVTFVIDEDVQYTLRDVKIEYPDLVRVVATEAEARQWAGETGVVRKTTQNEQEVWVAAQQGPIWGDQIRGLMLIKPGDAYSADNLDKSMNRLNAAFGKLGYTDVWLERRELRDEKAPYVDVVVNVRRLGNQYRIGEVIFKGNDITQTNVLNMQNQLHPGRPLDSTLIEETRKKLERSGLFEPKSVKIAIQQPDPEEPEYRDVLIEVKETNTGSFQIGGTIASDLGATASISLKQRNFDVSDWPDSFDEFLRGEAFRGGGQTFSIELLPGNEVQNYAISLTEPYFMDTNNTVGGRVFYRNREFREYTEERAGGSLTLGRKLGERWVLNVPVRLEQVQISDLQPDEPVDYFLFEEAKLITGVGLTLSRTTLDDPYLPGRGSKVDLGIERVGVLGGDFDFTLLNAEYDVYMTLNEDFYTRKTVLSMKSKVSYIPEGSDAAPVYERFYLGGRSFRGFGFRTISPRGIRNDTLTLGNDPVGGSFLFFFGAEVTQPLISDIVRLALFTDTGTVNNSVSLRDYRASVGVGLRILVPYLSPIPLAFDFGIPVKSESGDRDRLFSFYIDVPF